MRHQPRVERHVAGALHILSPHEQQLLRKRFGIGEQRQSLDDIRAQLQLTQRRVREIEARALRKLRINAAGATMQTPSSPRSTSGAITGLIKWLWPT